jgi:hypothetical protein
MNGQGVRRSFILFHCTLAVVIFIESTTTLWDAVAAHKFGSLSPHAALLSGCEAAASILFLLPRSLRVGGTALLVIFTIVIMVHGYRAELPIFVYGAGVIFVMVHGSGFSGKRTGL